jgi:hypothetical protein
MRGETVEVKCKRCKSPFVARVADRKRGWGRFCSKNCKASEQTARTGVSGPYIKHGLSNAFGANFSNEEHDCNKDWS